MEKLARPPVVGQLEHQIGARLGSDFLRLVGTVADTDKPKPQASIGQQVSTNQRSIDLIKTGTEMPAGMDFAPHCLRQVEKISSLEIFLGRL